MTMDGWMDDDIDIVSTVIIIVICDKHSSWYEGDDGMMVYPSDVW